jgi:hypothetical protein
MLSAGSSRWSTHPQPSAPRSGVRRLQPQWERCRGPRRSILGGQFTETLLGHERLEPQALDGTEVLDVGGEERQVMLDGGGADQGIGQAHAVR